VTTTTVGERCLSSKSPLGALVLFHLMREFKPRRCLELGTNLGISAAYQAAALRLNGGGELDTIEGAPAIAALARAHLASLQLSEATVHDFARIHPSLSPGALVIFDDVEWSPGMAAAWSAIRADTRVRVAVSLGRMGVCIVGGDGDAIRIDLLIPG
jgi:predicted O-methyltransferase YrrM